MDAARLSAPRLDEIAELARPVSHASEQALPVLPALESILPNRSLQRGSTLLVHGGPGAHSLALALAAGASRAGSWVAALGNTSLGVASAAELGVVLERLVLIAPPPASLWPTVAAALIDSFDVVLVDWPDVPGSMARRLGMRTRERKAVLLPVASGPKAPWSEAADLRLTVGAARWHGLGSGFGRLAARQVEVETGGRRSPRPYRTALWLPDERGEIRAGDVREFGSPAELIRFPAGGSPGRSGSAEASSRRTDDLLPLTGTESAPSGTDDLRPLTGTQSAPSGTDGLLPLTGTESAPSGTDDLRPLTGTQSAPSGPAGRAPSGTATVFSSGAAGHPDKPAAPLGGPPEITVPLKTG